ncbi:MAG: GIY-YIG nuclease family protein [Candidatus Omnitrophota bacterium]
MKKIIYAIKVADLAYSGLEIIDVKIGQTVDIDSTLRQYRRSNPNAEILDLWEINPSLTNAYNCETGVHKIAERYAYKRKKETFIFLQEGYQEFAENVNLLLKNITGSKTIKHGKTKKGEYKRSGYTAKKPYLIKFLGKQYPVATWREVLCKVAEEIYRNKNDFTPALNIKGSKRIYFSKNSKDLRDPLEIKGSPYFCEGNLSANHIVKITNTLLENFGYKPHDLEIECK